MDILNQPRTGTQGSLPSAKRPSGNSLARSHWRPSGRAPCWTRSATRLHPLIHYRTECSRSELFRCLVSLDKQ